MPPGSAPIGSPFGRGWVILFALVELGTLANPVRGQSPAHLSWGRGCGGGVTAPERDQRGHKVAPSPCAGRLQPTFSLAGPREPMVRGRRGFSVVSSGTPRSSRRNSQPSPCRQTQFVKGVNSVRGRHAYKEITRMFPLDSQRLHLVDSRNIFVECHTTCSRV